MIVDRLAVALVEEAGSVRVNNVSSRWAHVRHAPEHIERLVRQETCDSFLRPLSEIVLGHVYYDVGSAVYLRGRYGTDGNFLT